MARKKRFKQCRKRGLTRAEGVMPTDLQPVTQQEQGRLDETAELTCPERGHEFES